MNRAFSSEVLTAKKFCGPRESIFSSIRPLKTDGTIEELGPFGVHIHVLHLEPRVDPLPKLGQQK